VQITYLSINDFLNLLVQLRTVSELLEYLNARRALPVAALHTVGDEKPLFELYPMNAGNLNHCTGLADAKRALRSCRRRALARNAEYRHYSGLKEYLSRAAARLARASRTA